MRFRTWPPQGAASTRQPGGLAAGRDRARPPEGERPGGRGQVCLLRDPQGHGEKDAAEGFLERDVAGIIAIGIEKDDELVAAQVTDGQQIVLLATHQGMAVRFDEEDVRVDGTSGVRRARHETGRQGLHRRHGGDAEAV